MRNIIILIVGFLTLSALSGCGWVVMEPSGDIAKQEAQLIYIATFLMLIVIVPVIVMAILFAWKYRSSNDDADYDPEWNHSTTLEIIIWSIPLAIIIVLAGITFVATHRLDPYAPISRISEDMPVPDTAETLVIEAVAMDWKWLFFYPDHDVATVNEIAAPVNTPIKFKITSATVMNSFYIPALAGQIYAMAGMETKLHAVINETGSFKGFSANYSGHGFSDMRFTFHGMTESDFNDWMSKLKTSEHSLDKQTYEDLEVPSMAHPVTYYSSVTDKLYHKILNLCVKEDTVCMVDQMHEDARRASAEHKHESHGEH